MAIVTATGSPGAGRPEVLNAGRTRRAEAVAVEIAGRLADPGRLGEALRDIAMRTPGPEAAGWRPTSLAFGDAGVALLFGVLDRHRPYDGWDRIGHRFLTAAVAGLDARRTPLSLFVGASGVAAAAWSLSRDGERYRRLLAGLDTWLTGRATAAAGMISASRHGLGAAAYDVVHGLCGWAAALSLRGSGPAIDGALTAISAALVTAVDRDGLLIPPWLLTVEERATAPSGHVDCGLAHGLPGPLACLSLLGRERGITVRGLDEAIRRAADWLLERAVTDGDGVISWPAFCTPAGDGGWRGGAAPARAAWCYGSPGVARALWLAGEAVGEPRYRDAAMAAMAPSVAAPPAPLPDAAGDRASAGPGLCHGVAGRLLIGLLFDRDTAAFTGGGTGSVTRGERPAGLLDEMLALYEPAAPYGFRAVAADGARIDSPGLVSGAAGVALVLATAAGAAPDWSRLFLLT